MEGISWCLLLLVDWEKCAKMIKGLVSYFFSACASVSTLILPANFHLSFDEHDFECWLPYFFCVPSLPLFILLCLSRIRWCQHECSIHSHHATPEKKILLSKQSQHNTQSEFVSTKKKWKKIIRRNEWNKKKSSLNAFIIYEMATTKTTL